MPAHSLIGCKHQVERLGSPGLTLGLLSFIALWASWPLGLSWQSAIPTGDSPLSTVPLLNLWTIWWNAAQFSTGISRGNISGYWDAPIFFPSEGAFAFSEPQPATMCLAPIGYLLNNWVTAFNLYLLVTLVLNGYVGFRLLRALQCGWVVAHLGAIAILLHPLAWHNLEAMQLMVLWPVLWTMELISTSPQRSPQRTGLLLGLALSCGVATCIHHFVFLIILLALSGWVFLIDSDRNRLLLGLLISTAIAAIPLLLILIPMWQIHSSYGLERRLENVAALSASPGDWLHVPTGSSVADVVGLNPRFPLSPGYARCICAAFCLATLFRFKGSRFRKSQLIFLFLFGASAMLLASGAHLAIGSYNIWEMLVSVGSPLAAVRSPYRFAYFAQLAVLLLAFVAAQQSREWLHRLKKHRHTATTNKRWVLAVRRSAAWTAALVLPIYLAFEVVPARSYLAYPPQGFHEEPWIEFLNANAAAGSSLLCLPVAAGGSERQMQQATLWMAYGMQHRLHLLNGYSGFIPEEWALLRDLLVDAPFSIEVSNRLQEMGVEWIAIRKDRMAKRNANGLPDQPLNGYSAAFEDDKYLIWQRSTIRDAPTSAK